MKYRFFLAILSSLSCLSLDLSAFYAVHNNGLEADSYAENAFTLQDVGQNISDFATTPYQNGIHLRNETHSSNDGFKKIHEPVIINMIMTIPQLSGPIPERGSLQITPFAIGPNGNISVGLPT